MDLAREADWIDVSLEPHDLAGLICKLRWARMENEAQQLELALGSFPPEQRGTVCVGPFSTD